MKGGRLRMGFMDWLKKEEPSSNYRKTGLETNVSNYGWYECVHCHKKFRKGDIEIDHIIPRSKGGTNDPKNLQCLCVYCNRSKGNDMSQTKADLKTRKGSYGQWNRSRTLKPMIQQKNQDIRRLCAQLSDEDIREMMRSPKYKDGWVELKREARKRGLL